MRKAVYLTALILFLAGTVFFVFRSWLRQGELVAFPEIQSEGKQVFIVRPEEEGKRIHIYLSEEEDFYRALGFSQAWAVGDRLMYLRLSARGKLSRYFGEEYISADTYLKAWPFETLATKTLSNLPDETRDNLERFVRGINQRFSSFPPPSGCRWYHVDTTPWIAEDVLAIWHLLRWAQCENWSLPFFIRYAEIYYGPQVKKQFETILNVSLPGFEPGHIRDFMAFYELDRNVREKVGLMPVFLEQSTEGFPLFGYSGGENEDWIDFVIHQDSSTTRILQHTGLPLIFYGDKGYASPASCHVVPAGPVLPAGARTETDTSIHIELPNFTLQVPLRLFDINGDVFAHLMNQDSLDIRFLKDFSYAVSAEVIGYDTVPSMIRGVSEKELAVEIGRKYPEHEALNRLCRTQDPALWGAFVATLLERVYRDDVQIIFPDFASWPGDSPGLFLKHLLMIMKNPYSAWWDDRQTAHIVERMDDIFTDVGETVFSQYSHGKLSVHIEEGQRNPLGRFHILTGAYRHFSKDIKIPLAIVRKDDSTFLYNRFVWIPNYKSSENSLR
ncbi:MAG: penicillin amidase [Candidatus Marinimicrobia bacterium]|nr:penicillin amidase [Candidatus Neomarinimicrobiota bacterium]